MDLPPNLLIANFGVVSGGAGVTTAGTLIGSPGVGLRNRLWACWVGPNATAQAPTKWTFDVINAAVTLGYGRIARGGFESGELYWPGGFADVSGAATGWVLQSAVGAISFGLTIAYTVEEG